MIAALVAKLAAEGIHADARELADALWLATIVPALSLDPIEAPTTRTAPRHEHPRSPKPTSDGSHDGPRASSRTGSPAPPPTEATPSSRAELLVPERTRSNRAAAHAGLPIRAPAAAALPTTLEIGRAMRPLRRRAPTASDRHLDEEATVQRIVEEHVWIPVFRPELARWLDVALVVDGAASMALWHRAIVDFTTCLRQGAFRDVRRWTLDSETTTGTPRLFAGSTPSGPSHDAREIVDPTRRRLILLVTDGVAAAWRDGRAAQLLRCWGQHGPTAIIDVLPEHLWLGTAIGDAVPVRVTTRGPGVPNAELVIETSRRRRRVRAKQEIAFPVVMLTPESLGALARIVAASPRASVAGRVFDPLRTTSEIGAREGDVERTARQERHLPISSGRKLVERFEGMASPTAQKLAQLLAAAPLSLPVVRLVREVMLPASTNAHIAEVFLGGIVERVPSATPTVRPDEVEYDFREGVRDELLQRLPVDESLAVLEGVSRFVEDRFGHTIDFAAWLVDPSLASTEWANTTHSRPFATVAADVLRPLGGKYRELADRLRPTREPTRPMTTPPSSRRAPVSEGPANAPALARKGVLSWVHLSDLQLEAQSALRYPNRHEASRVVQALGSTLQRTVGDVQLVFISGDLTQYGRAEEFAAADAFLTALRSSVGQRAVILPVPGNHDADRSAVDGRIPEHELAAFRSSSSRRNEFWSNPEDPIRRHLAATYRSYAAWSAHVLGVHPVRWGLLPGDFSLSLDLGSRIGIVGLNAEILSSVSDRHEAFIDLRQIEAACGEEPHAWAARHDATFLVTHHAFERSDPPFQRARMFALLGRLFDVHLYGAHSRAAERPVRERDYFAWQGRSLGTARPNAARGIDVAQLSFGGPERALRVWPLVVREDTLFNAEHEDHVLPVRWRAATHPPPPRARLLPPAPQALPGEIVVKLSEVLAQLEERRGLGRRHRSATEADPKLTQAYVQFVVAYAGALVGEEDFARTLVERATKRLDARDRIHAFLSEAYTARIDQAIVGAPIGTPLPQELLATLEALAKLDRYKVDRVRQASKVLEPLRTLDPIMDFQRGTYVPAPFEALQLAESDTVAHALEDILGDAPSLPFDEHAQLLDGAMDLLSSLAAGRALPLLEEMMAQITRTQSPARTRLLAKLIVHCGHFGTRSMTERALDTFFPTLSLLGAAELAPHIDAVVGILRQRGMREELSRLSLLDVQGRSTLHTKVRVSLAGAKAYAGVFEPQAFEESLALLDGEMPTPERMQLTYSTARALGSTSSDYAFAGLHRLATRLVVVTDSFNTNTHVCISVLSFVEALALGYSDLVSVGAHSDAWV